MNNSLTIPHIVTVGELENIVALSVEMQLKLTSRAEALATVFDQDIKALTALHEETFDVQKEAEERLATIKEVS